MTAQEKAKAGLWMIEEAIRQSISQMGRPMQPSEVCDNLDLRRPTSEPHSASIVHQIMLAMAETGKLTKEGSPAKYDVPQGSTHS